jgi:hypothetical protein
VDDDLHLRPLTHVDFVPAPAPVGIYPTAVSTVNAKPAAPRRLSNAPLRILHLTDFHYDALYTPGAFADCGLCYQISFRFLFHISPCSGSGDIVCCRADDFNGTRKAAYFGDYVCDLPQWTAEAMLAHAAAMQPPIDLVVWTGGTSHSAGRVLLVSNRSVCRQPVS